jgi:cellulose synthase/poly-beta-1,6-N-acetylglucosamine synthase-like glycosyltransferase
MTSKQAKPPRLSVIIAAFNCQHTLGACLRAIRGSAFTDYELIVADDGSTDGTAAVAAEYADKLLKLAHAGRTHARLSGVKAAAGEILINVDSDVLVRPDTLTVINAFFDEQPQADALTGCLTKHTPAPGFFSQYKNLYMHHIFQLLPARVAFLYGSVYATRRALWADPRHYLTTTAQGAAPADDTELGQLYTAAGKHIAFIKDLQVTHLKEYSFASFFKNDFDIPFGWAQIFLRRKGWRQLGRAGTGFCHSPRSQLLGVMLAPLLPLAFALAGAAPGGGYAPLALAAAWLALNLRFLAFLAREKGLFFGLQGALVTYFDNLVMAAGITCGLLAYTFKPRTFCSFFHGN